MAVVIIAKNQTAGDLALTQLLAEDSKIPASGQRDLTEFNSVDQIQKDTELFNYVTNDDVLLNRDAVDLTKAQSLHLLVSLEPLHNLTAVTIPTTGDDEDDGYSKGSNWVNTATDRAYVCSDSSSGTAVWVDITQNPFTDLGAVTDDPTGFPNRTDSQISFDPTGPPVRTFTIEPLAPATSFVFYVKGAEFTKTSAETVQITDTAGLWFIRYNTSGVLVASQTPFDFSSEAFVAIIYWNTDSVPNKYILGEERHGLSMDWRTHKYLHETRGTTYNSRSGGLGASGYTLNDDSDAGVQLGISNGEIDDEDINILITHAASPSNPFEQILTKPAQIPVYHRSGNPGLWVKDNATTFWFKNTGSGRVAWNENSGGTWGQTELENNDYVAYWLVATNDPAAPVVSIQGQRTDGNLDNARDNNTLSSLDVGDLPFVEMRVLYRFILRSASGFGGTRKAKILDVVDLRNASGMPGGTFSPPAAGDVVGPTLSIDYGMAVFNGTTGKLIQDSGKRNYGGSATDPTVPTPADGDLYYNTVLDMWMAYDAARSKFLSIAESVFFFGKQGTTPAGGYYRGVGNLSYSSADGKRAEFNGSIVSIEYTRTDTDSSTFEVTANGSGIATLASTAVAGGDVTLNANFTAGQILGVRNQTGGNATSNVHGSVRLRWRV